VIKVTSKPTGCHRRRKNTATETDDDEINEYIDVTLDAIKHFSLKLEGKPTEVEYHPAIMKMCCNLYMKAPSAYVDFQKKSIMPMPSETTMK
jgi:hypothetical protein